MIQSLSSIKPKTKAQAGAFCLPGGLVELCGSTWGIEKIAVLWFAGGIRT